MFNILNHTILKKNTNSLEKKDQETEKQSFSRIFSSRKSSSLFELIFPKKHILQCVGSSSAAASSSQEYRQPTEVVSQQADESLVSFSSQEFSEELILKSSLRKVFCLRDLISRVRLNCEYSQTRKEIRESFFVFAQSVKTYYCYFDISLTTEEREDYEQNDSLTEREIEEVDKSLQILYFAISEPEKLQGFFDGKIPNFQNTYTIVLNDLFHTLTGRQPIFSEEFLRRENIVKTRLEELSPQNLKILKSAFSDFLFCDELDGIKSLLDLHIPLIREGIERRLKHAILNHKTLKKYHKEDMLNLLEETFNLCYTFAQISGFPNEEAKRDIAQSIVDDFINRLGNKNNISYAIVDYTNRYEDHLSLPEDIQDEQFKEIIHFHYRQLLGIFDQPPRSKTLEEKLAATKATALRLHLSEYQFVDNMNEKFISGFLTHLIKKYLLSENMIFFPEMFYQLGDVSYFHVRMTPAKCFFALLPSVTFENKQLEDFEKPDVFVTLPALVLAAESTYQKTLNLPSVFERDLDIISDYYITNKKMYGLLKKVYLNSKEKEEITKRLTTIFFEKISSLEYPSGVLTAEEEEYITTKVKRSISAYQYISHESSPWKKYLTEVEMIDLVSTDLDQQIKEGFSPLYIYFPFYFDLNIDANQYYSMSGSLDYEHSVYRVIYDHKFLKEFNKTKKELGKRIKGIAETQKAIIEEEVKKELLDYRYQELADFSQDYFGISRRLTSATSSVLEIEIAKREINKDLERKQASLIKIQEEIKEDFELREALLQATEDFYRETKAINDFSKEEDLLQTLLQDGLEDIPELEDISEEEK